MNCKNCGAQNVNGERFCKNCGVLLESDYHVLSEVKPNTSISEGNQQVQQPMYEQTTNNNGSLDPNYVQQAVNPNMKKWAVLSIVVPIVAILIYTFIGLSFYIAMLIAGAGLGFAKKGEMAEPKLAKIGKILNYCLIGMAIVMLILILISGAS